MARRLPLIARALLWFWGTLAAAMLVTAVVLQTMGPPPPAGPTMTADATPPSVILPVPAPVAPPASRPGRDTPGPIASPDPGLLEVDPDDPAAMLPRIAADGRAPMGVYARGFDQSTRRPRIGLLFAGFGPSQADSEEAIRALPGGVTLAFSPYGSHLPRLLDVARLAGHEYLLSLPMEPAGYPQNDAGDHALLTTQDAQTNAAGLRWALSRMQGYVGVTGALGPLRGERFAQASGPMDAMLHTLAARGLLYVDPGVAPGPLPYAWTRRVDLVVDEPAVRTEIDAKLAALERIARDRGSALGLAGVLRPLTVARVEAWADTLQARGLALAPVSALVQPPPLPRAGSAGASR
ncbi:divergent polysaccharide deacetylase family protein [Acidisphaera rubrifaciens]|uniref:Polysaccharide deacetylase n=1 Tax=Acidisphaera rubrifaciens HS-AP3 TaxID=1231350 RepID=A0A0D6P752_9PROT|nr:divergent polysaccharide deacetylase family protein [Acidisphaera rubrifaciens]GAN77512.1 hypothetical protein Asru_0351_07 [Acidisphaera rubrifaciens HS-AP3]